MVAAYVLIQTEVGKAAQVAGAIADRSTGHLPRRGHGTASPAFNPQVKALAERSAAPIGPAALPNSGTAAPWLG